VRETQNKIKDMTALVALKWGYYLSHDRGSTCTKLYTLWKGNEGDDNSLP